MDAISTVELIGYIANPSNWRSFGGATEQILEKSKQLGRKVEITGEENLPKEGGYILASNHFAPVENLKKMTGKMKDQHLLEVIGSYSKLIRETTGGRSHMVLAITEVNRPEGLFPKGKPAREVLKWLTTDAIYGSANVLRRAMLAAYKRAEDLLPLPIDMEKLPTFFMKARKEISAGNVLVIMPEGNTAYALGQMGEEKMEPAKNGMALLSYGTKSQVVPVAQYKDGDTLKISIGQPIGALTDLKSQTEYTTGVMSAMAQMLPPPLRGAYA